MYQPVKKTLSILAIVGFLLLSFQQSGAQPFSKTAEKDFNKRQDSLRKFADAIVMGRETTDRFRSDSLFTKMLVRALKQKNSFYFPFDSLETISRLYAPDSSFRIFTWQLKKDEMVYMQHGAIQMRTADGSLKLFGLHDASMFTSKPLDSVRNNNNWIGAIYYRIVLKTFNDKKYYTLLGFDDYSISSSRKWMEVLTFNNAGEPVFGGPYISFKEDSGKKATQVRFNLEYKKEASVSFNYDPEMDLILYDNLMPESPSDSDKKYTYIPNGDFEAFKWKEGQWVHVDNVFNVKLKDGDYPREKMILDNNGNIDEDKLMEQSNKNILKKTAPKVKPVKKDGDS